MKNTKFLVSTLSGVLLFNNFMPCFAQKTNDLSKAQQAEFPTRVVKPNNETDNIENTDGHAAINWIKNHKILSSIIGIGAIADGLNMLIWQTNPTCLKSIYDSEFSNVTPNTYTKKQEGQKWCGIACLQGLLKHENIEIPQKDIYKGYFENIRFIPIFETHRIKGAFYLNKNVDTNVDKQSLETLSSLAVLSNKLPAFVEKITNDKYTCKVDFVTVDNKDKQEFKNHIINQMKSTFATHKIFSILDGFSYSRGKQPHLVNVVNIYNGCITIEDPASGYSYKRGIDNFAEELSEIANRETHTDQEFYNNGGVPIVYLEKKS